MVTSWSIERMGDAPTEEGRGFHWAKWGCPLSGSHTVSLVATAITERRLSVPVVLHLITITVSGDTPSARRARAPSKKGCLLPGWR